MIMEKLKYHLTIVQSQVITTLDDLAAVVNANQIVVRD